MNTFEITSEKPIDTYELKSELEKIKKRDKELNFRAAKTEEYLKDVAHYKKTQELLEKVRKLNIPRLKENQIRKLIDIMPQTIQELKTVLQGYTLNLNNENMKKIVNVIDEFVKNK